MILVPQTLRICRDIPPQRPIHGAAEESQVIRVLKREVGMARQQPDHAALVLLRAPAAVILSLVLVAVDLVQRGRSSIEGLNPEILIQGNVERLQPATDRVVLVKMLAPNS